MKTKAVSADLSRRFTLSKLKQKFGPIGCVVSSEKQPILYLAEHLNPKSKSRNAVVIVIDHCNIKVKGKKFLLFWFLSLRDKRKMTIPMISIFLLFLSLILGRILFKPFFYNYSLGVLETCNNGRIYSLDKKEINGQIYLIIIGSRNKLEIVRILSEDLNNFQVGNSKSKL